jgi:hypothetical protein
MRKLIALLLLAGMIPAAQASMKCQSIGTNGTTINILIDKNFKNFIYNGESHYFVAETKNGKGRSSENFKNRYGHVVYISLASLSNGTDVMAVMNAKDDKVLGEFELMCEKEGS